MRGSKQVLLLGSIFTLLLLGGGIYWAAHRPTVAPISSTKSTSTDAIPPEIRITVSPSSLQNIQDSLEITVDATDSQGVARVEYRIDNAFAAVNYNAPFSMKLDTSTLVPGTHTVTATAFDRSGNKSSVSEEFIIIARSAGQSTTDVDTSATSHATTSSKSQIVSVSAGGGSSNPLTDSTAPSAPTNLVASDPGTFFVHLTWTASTDNVGVTGYQIWRDGVMIGTTQNTNYDDQQSLPGATYSYRVVAYDAAGNTAASTSVGITLSQASIFNSADIPPASDSGDTGSVEVGTKFTATKDGNVTAVRFYKSIGDTGTHVGDLWANDGTKLASVTFSGESSSGWQTANFSTPVHITAGTTYVISYFAPNGHYTASSHYFDVSHATNSYLTGLASGNNGLYVYSGSPALPINSFHAANYWVDVTFVPDTAATFASTPTCSAYPSFPDVNCTGMIGGDNMTALSGGVVLNDSDQVYSNLKVDGNIVVTGCNVTLRNIEVDAGEPYTGDLTTPDLFAIWLQVPANCTTTIDRVSIITKDAPNNYVTTGIRVSYGGPVNITNTKVIGSQIGILTGPGLLQDNYVELGSTQRGDHNEDILEDGVTNLTLQHNTFLNQNNQTAALALFTEFGPNSNLLIQNNLLAGGGYTVYAGDGVTDNHGNPAPSNNVSFVGNVFWRRYFPDVGAFASGRSYNPAGGGAWTNNRYMNSDGTLTTEQVPQPPLDH